MIEQYSFGNIVINGRTFTSDLKILKGRVISDWWRKVGHSVSIDDVRDILDAKPDCFVLGKGKPGLMKADAALREALGTKGIELIEESTSEAIKSFNRLAQEGRDVAAGFHLTC